MGRSQLLVTEDQRTTKDSCSFKTPKSPGYVQMDFPVCPESFVEVEGTRRTHDSYTRIMEGPRLIGLVSLSAETVVHRILHCLFFMCIIFRTCYRKLKSKRLTEWFLIPDKSPTPV